MYRKKHAGPREQFRVEEAQRVDDSSTLAVKFPELKSLSAEFHFSDSEKQIVTGHVKYQFNLELAKSVFRFSCPNNECIRGDFDLTDALKQAVAGRRKQVAGEIPCRGWLSKTTIDTVHCRMVMRYRLNLTY